MTDEIRSALALFASRGFDVRVFPTAAEMKRAVVDAVDDGRSAGFGGSVTCQWELGLPESLADKGCTVYSHWKTPVSQDPDIFRKANHADVYFTSCNAIACTGELMVCDGLGNRLSAICYGPGEVYFLAGINKFVPDQHAGEERIRHTAFPKNVQRLHGDAPCASGGVCIRCTRRVCETSGFHLSVTHPGSRKLHLWIAEEALGY